FIFVFWDAHLYGDFVLHLIYLVFSFYGLYHWLYGSNTINSLPISHASFRELVVLISIGTISIPLVAQFFIHFFEKPYQPYWNAVIFSFSLVAQWQLAQKKIENWLFWIGIDCVGIILYFSKGLFLTSFLYFLYLVLASWGYWNWKKILLQQVS
ncbi:MAG: nicotinamide riboside transporter PnuC, partial [Flammeovirgaceae bacterium]|nr:nicotinamide riboside transporter PnuC [Flammeovirgaceae bacterium]MDW8287427.1 nicotinamide riboside transporter PnuC [Flammeovirgaceae bacterium]